MTLILRFLVCLLFVTSPALSAEFAAELKRQDDGRKSQLVIHLSGPIAAGDADQIRKIFLNSALMSNDDNADLVLSLNSPGGSFSEALNIARVLNENGISTYVGDGAQCLSACAIAFMAGADIKSQFTTRNRMIHPRARLGFHAPSLAVPNTGDVPAEQLGAAFAVALSSISEVLEAEQYLGMSRSLLVRMIATPPEEMFYITTTGMAGMWDIDIDEPSPDFEMSQQALVNVCANLQAWTDDKKIVGAMGASVFLPPSPTDPQFRVERFGFTAPYSPRRNLYWMPSYGEYTLSCYVYKNLWTDPNGEDPTQVFSAVAGLTRDDAQSIVRGLESRNLRPTWLPWFASLPAETPLVSLGDAGGRLAPPWTLAPNPAQGLCRVFGKFNKPVSESPCEMRYENGGYAFAGGPEITDFVHKWQGMIAWEGVQGGGFSPEGRHAQSTCIFDQRSQERLCFQR